MSVWSRRLHGSQHPASSRRRPLVAPAVAAVVLIAIATATGTSSLAWSPDSVKGDCAVEYDKLEAQVREGGDPSFVAATSIYCADAYMLARMAGDDETTLKADSESFLASCKVPSDQHAAILRPWESTTLSARELSRLEVMTEVIADNQGIASSVAREHAIRIYAVDNLCLCTAAARLLIEHNICSGTFRP